MASDLPVLITDFDGIMTSPMSLFDESGRTHKMIPVNDSLIVKYLCPEMFKKIIILTAGGNGSGFDITLARVRDLVKFVDGDIEIKLVKCPSVVKSRYINVACDSNKVVYFGDDITDILVLKNRHSNLIHAATPISAPWPLATYADSTIDTSKGVPFFTKACLQYATKDDIKNMHNRMLQHSYSSGSLDSQIEEVLL